MPRHLSAVALLVVSVCVLTSYSQAQARVVGAEGHQWWQNAVCYEMYSCSSADGNSNGIGDFKGIGSKLDYLKDLGVDAIWISPCYPSFQVDGEYDVSDYENIESVKGGVRIGQCGGVKIGQ